MANSYYSEALCHLGRVDAAFEGIAYNKELCRSPDRPTFFTTHSMCNSKFVSDFEIDISVVTMVNEASLHILRGNLEEAQKLIESSLVLNPKYFPAQRNLIYLLLRNGDVLNAKKFFFSRTWPSS